MIDFLTKNGRWVSGGFLLMMFSSFGQTYFISFSSSELRSEFNLSHGDFGQLYLIATLASAMTLPFLGRIVDVMPVRFVLTGTMIALAAACLSMSYVASIPALVITIFTLRLFGQGMMMHVAMTAMGRWFSAQRGKAVSIASLGYNVAEGTFPTITVFVFAAVGWRSGWQVAALILIVFALPLAFLLLRKDRIPQSQIERENKEVGKQWTRAQALKDPVFWALLISVMGPSFIGTTLLFHHEHLIEFRGWDQGVFAIGFSTMAATTVAVALITGVLIDRYSSLPFLPLEPIPKMLSSLCIFLFPNEWAIFLILPLMGFSAGMMSSLMGTLWPEIYGTKHLGSIRSITIAGMVLSSALGPGLTGWALDQGYPLPNQFLVMAGFSGLSIFVMLWAQQKIKARRRDFA